MWMCIKRIDSVSDESRRESTSGPTCAYSPRIGVRKCLSAVRKAQAITKLWQIRAAALTTHRVLFSAGWTFLHGVNLFAFVVEVSLASGLE